MFKEDRPKIEEKKFIRFHGAEPHQHTNPRWCFCTFPLCLFGCFFYSSLPVVSVISSSRGSKPLTPRRYLGAEENRGWKGARRWGEEKWEQTDSVSVVSPSAMEKKKTTTKQTQKKTTPTGTNAAADGEELDSENAMSRLIRLIGNLGAGDFQGFVFFFAVVGAKTTERHKRGFGSQKNK